MQLLLGEISENLSCNRENVLPACVIVYFCFFQSGWCHHAACRCRLGRPPLPHVLLGNGSYHWLVLRGTARGHHLEHICLRNNDLAYDLLADDAWGGRGDDRWRCRRLLGTGLGLFLGCVFGGLGWLVAPRRPAAATVTSCHAHYLIRLLVDRILLEGEVVNSERAAGLVHCKSPAHLHNDPEVWHFTAYHTIHSHDVNILNA